MAKKDKKKKDKDSTKKKDEKTNSESSQGKDAIDLEAEWENRSKKKVGKK